MYLVNTYCDFKLNNPTASWFISIIVACAQHQAAENVWPPSTRQHDDVMVNETQPGNDEPSEGEEDVQTRCAFHQVTFMELYYIVLYIPIEARAKSEIWGERS